MRDCKSNLQNVRPNGKERRIEQNRKTVRLFVVFHNSENGETSPAQVGYTRDISETGLYFYTPGLVLAGEDIALTVYIPALLEGDLPPRLETKGEVLRVEQIEERESYALYGVAVKYSEQVRVLD